MAKSEVYTWRLDPALKRELEAAARADGVTLGTLLERACREWLERKRSVDQSSEDMVSRHRAQLDEIFEFVDARQQPDAPTRPATNAEVREAFAEKLTTDLKRRTRVSG